MYPSTDYIPLATNDYATDWRETQSDYGLGNIKTQENMKSYSPLDVIDVTARIV